MSHDFILGLLVIPAGLLVLAAASDMVDPYSPTSAQKASK